MSNPEDATEVQACIDAGIDLMVIWDSQIEELRYVIHAALPHSSRLNPVPKLLSY